ncbi:MAG: hypothetical protein ABF506_01750 [Zymomonas mobilis]|uniref:hypothetical protein n=1 Tax=Zymomonas mobilis TaxID=542 RepID=UPI0011517B3D|nr:hypothetical protein [Zymomonas mobilis]MCP9307590.1 hypothetical protein [Zymomonas mobilis]
MSKTIAKYRFNPQLFEEKCLFFNMLCGDLLKDIVSFFNALHSLLKNFGSRRQSPVSSWQYNVTNGGNGGYHATMA